MKHELRLLFEAFYDVVKTERNSLHMTLDCTQRLTCI